jgi:hypothetical protein
MLTMLRVFEWVRFCSNIIGFALFLVIVLPFVLLHCMLIILVSAAMLCLEAFNR